VRTLRVQYCLVAIDSRNRLVAAGETSYRYDAENQRVGVNQTRYVINSQPALSQVLVKEEKGVKTFYVYGLGLLGEEKEGEYRSYHFDFRGSTVVITDQTGKVVERFQYGPYGELLKGEASVTPFLFNGKYGVMTDDNGLYYMRARFYSAAMKRFVNQDVLLGNVSEGQTLNRYAFVTGKVVSFIDPNGLDLIMVFYWNVATDYIKLYSIGRQTETDVQELIRQLVQEGTLPKPQRNSPRDAFRHCTAACTLAGRVGREDAELAQDIWEFLGNISGSSVQDMSMDYHNNWCGFNFAQTGKNSLAEYAENCMGALNRRGYLIQQAEPTDTFWATFGWNVLLQMVKMKYGRQIED